MPNRSAAPLQTANKKLYIYIYARASNFNYEYYTHRHESNDFRYIPKIHCFSKFIEFPLNFKANTPTYLESHYPILEKIEWASV